MPALFSFGLGVTQGIEKRRIAKEQFEAEVGLDAAQQAARMELAKYEIDRKQQFQAVQAELSSLEFLFKVETNRNEKRRIAKQMEIVAGRLKTLSGGSTPTSAVGGGGGSEGGLEDAGPFPVVTNESDEEKKARRYGNYGSGQAFDPYYEPPVTGPEAAGVTIDPAGRGVGE